MLMLSSDWDDLIQCVGGHSDKVKPNNLISNRIYSTVVCGGGCECVIGGWVEDRSHSCKVIIHDNNIAGGLK